MNSGACFSTAIELSVSKHVGNFLTDLGTIGFSGNTLLHGIKASNQMWRQGRSRIGTVTNHELPSNKLNQTGTVRVT